MSESKTVLIEVDELSQLPRAAERMYIDREVGGIILRQLLSPYRCRRLLDEAEFKSEPKFRTINRHLKSHFDRGLRGSSVKITDRGNFTSSHDWHLAVTKPDPSLKLWVNARGAAKFSVARARDLNVPTGFGFTDEEVARCSYAQASDFTAEPGDALLFIDFGSVFTGPSTFHKVEALSEDRLSRAWDLEYRPHA